MGASFCGGWPRRKGQAVERNGSAVGRTQTVRRAGISQCNKAQIQIAIACIRMYLA